MPKGRIQPPGRVPTLRNGAPPPMRMPELAGPRARPKLPMQAMSRPSLDAGKGRRVSMERPQPGQKPKASGDKVDVERQGDKEDESTA